MHELGTNVITQTQDPIQTKIHTQNGPLMNYAHTITNTSNMLCFIAQVVMNYNKANSDEDKIL